MCRENSFFEHPEVGEEIAQLSLAVFLQGIRPINRTLPLTYTWSLNIADLAKVRKVYKIETL